MPGFRAQVWASSGSGKQHKMVYRKEKMLGDSASCMLRKRIFLYHISIGIISGKALTMEWVDGVKLNEPVAIESQGLKVLDLVNRGIQCSLRQLLEYGYFHADPHPGNLLATPDGKLTFLDFGMMSETPEEARYAIIGHVVHMVNRDYEAMARDYYALDFLSHDVDVSPIVPALRDFLDDALSYAVAQLPEARDLGGRVAGEVTRRLAARFLQQILRTQTPSSPSLRT